MNRTGIRFTFAHTVGGIVIQVLDQQYSESFMYGNDYQVSLPNSEFDHYIVVISLSVQI